MKLYRYIKVLESKKENEDDEPKITVSSKLKNALEESRLYFSHPSNFNDPLECIIPITLEDYEHTKDKYHQYISNFLTERIGRLEDDAARNKRIYEAINFGMRLENCLITCFSKTSNHQLMWSHYADQHQGICLCYEFPDTIEEWKEQIQWSNTIAYDIKNYGLILEGDAVRYQQERPSFKIKDTSLPVGEWTFTNEYSLKDAIFTKPKCWCYEQEWRLVLSLPINCGIAFSSRIDMSDYYAIIPRKWLKEITFGLRLDESYCNEIVNIIHNSSYNDVVFTKSQLAHNEFRILPTPYKTV